MCNRMLPTTNVLSITQQTGVNVTVLVVRHAELVTLLSIYQYGASHESHSVWTLIVGLKFADVTTSIFRFPASGSSNNSQGIVGPREWCCLYYRPVLYSLEFKMLVQFLFTVVYLCLFFCILCVWRFLPRICNPAAKWAADGKGRRWAMTFRFNNVYCNMFMYVYVYNLRTECLYYKLNGKRNRLYVLTALRILVDLCVDTDHIFCEAETDFLNTV